MGRVVFSVIILAVLLLPFPARAYNMLEGWLSLEASTIRCEESDTVAECYVERIEKSLKGLEHLNFLLSQAGSVSEDNEFLKNFRAADSLVERHRAVREARGPVSFLLTVEMYWHKQHDLFEGHAAIAERELHSGVVYCEADHGGGPPQGCEDILALDNELQQMMRQADTISQEVLQRID